MSDLVIQSHVGPYEVQFGEMFAGIESGLSEGSHLVIDTRVAELYAENLKLALMHESVIRIEATETNKSLEQIPSYVMQLLANGIKRDHLLIAVGGGIIQDITSFIAATLFRGIEWRFYPTTLLAQADSCIGSKSSINVGQYKNQIGTFTPPRDIRISSDVLGTLDAIDIRSGIGEMIKVHAISGWGDVRAIADDYSNLLTDRASLSHYIRRSLEIKKLKIEADEFDRDERLVMNYGHSFGHAIESATDYVIPHGIAVTIGMDMANYISWKFGLSDQNVYEELHDVLAKNYAGFEQTRIPEDRFFVALSRDKKNVGSDLSLILMRKPGEVFRDRYPNDGYLHKICREFFLFLRARRVECQAEVSL